MFLVTLSECGEKKNLSALFQICFIQLIKRTYHSVVHSNETKLGRWHEYLNSNMLDQNYDRLLKIQITIDKNNAILFYHYPFK